MASIIEGVANSYLAGGISVSSQVDWGDAVMHVMIVLLAITVLAVSLLAYNRTRSRRYLLLSVGFLFLLLSQVATLLEVVFFSNALLIIPSIGLHLSHIFDFMTLLFFLVAITNYGQNPIRSRSTTVPFSGPDNHSAIKSQALKNVAND